MRVACQHGEFTFIFRDDDQPFRDIPQSVKMLRKCLLHVRQSHPNQGKNFIYERVEEFINSLKTVREICILWQDGHMEGDRESWEARANRLLSKYRGDFPDVQKLKWFKIIVIDDKGNQRARVNLQALGLDGICGPL